jgi:hypothetical protein
VNLQIGAIPAMNRDRCVRRIRSCRKTPAGNFPPPARILTTPAILARCHNLKSFLLPLHVSLSIGKDEVQREPLLPSVRKTGNSTSATWAPPARPQHHKKLHQGLTAGPGWPADRHA